jgi:hypothetical protein
VTLALPRSPRAVYLGIDPGLSGAVVGLDLDSQVLFSAKAPTYRKPQNGTRYNLPGMLQLLKDSQAACPLVYCCIEKSQSRPTDSRPAAWTTGCGFGYWQMALTSLNIPYEIIRPRQWQKEFFPEKGGRTPKELSILTAKELLPNLNLLPTPRCRKDDHNLSDAGLLALYCIGKFRS